MIGRWKLSGGNAGFGCLHQFGGEEAYQGLQQTSPGHESLGQVASGCHGAAGGGVSMEGALEAQPELPTLGYCRVWAKMVGTEPH